MTATYYTGDVLEVLGKLPEASVDLVLTSPPFLGLRSYLPADHPDKAKEGGQERTPGEFIDWLLDVVEACDRVLAPHGSMAIELGDTLSGGGGWGDYPDEKNARRTEFDSSRGSGKAKGDAGWPADKCLALIPETFRFALAYGINPHTGRTTRPWRVRNVVRWVRPNPPVGALGDKFRPATSEMVVFCRTDEAGRKRYFDLDAVREAHQNGRDQALVQASSAAIPSQRAGKGERFDGKASGDGFVNAGNPAGAPPLDWWEIPTHAYKGSHYATWPPDLCVKPIKAMSPERVCVTCGEASRRVVEMTPEYRDARASLRDGDPSSHTGYEQASTARGASFGSGGGVASKITNGLISAVPVTLGWTSCPHDNDRPGVVLDPFAGSGTTLAVAIGHGRDAIGIDLDERNVELARDRVGPMFFEWANETNRQGENDDR